jgi:uncharacterized protein (DUF488 family)
LRRHAIEVLVDVRSQPYSRYAPQFNQEALRRAVTQAGIAYRYLGKELGGRPAQRAFYDEGGHVVYARVAQSGAFQQGLRQLAAASQRHRVAIMCSEENPAQCHRYLLIGRALAEHNITLHHIRGDGRIQTSDELERAAGDQPALPGFEEYRWRSTRSVSPRRPRRSSSAPSDAPE